MTQPTCKKRIANEYKGRINDLRKLWNLYSTDTEAYDDELGNFNEYGLSFDYVAPGTFKGQRKGYFQYLLSYGGPSDEFRFYTDGNFNITKIEYWFLDWFDGAKVIVKGNEYNLLSEIFDDFKSMGLVEDAYYKAVKQV